MSGMALLALTFAGASAAAAQEPAKEPAKPVLTLEGDAVMITMLIKPDKTADFEDVIAKYKEALAKNDKVAARKQQLDGMKFFKSSQQAQGNAMYIIYVEPVIKGEEYDISRVIAEVFPVEVQAIFEKYKGAFAGRGITNLSKVAK
jgi:hypothetical protein